MLGELSSNDAIEDQSALEGTLNDGKNALQDRNRTRNFRSCFKDAARNSSEARLGARNTPAGQVQRAGAAVRKSR